MSPILITGIVLSFLAIATGCADFKEVDVQNLSDDAKQQMIARGYSRSKRLFPEVQEISAYELKERLEQDELVVVDVRSPAERAVSMIKGAISSTEFEQNRAQYENVTVVTYCSIGHRSGLYAKKLHEEGFEVLNLVGSVLSWSHVAGDFVDAHGPTKRVHVGGPNSNFVASGYDPTW
ncbi:MAG: rhodanese-like domain-containing protein [Thermoanaerobaculia bacterium]